MLKPITIEERAKYKIEWIGKNIIESMVRVVSESLSESHWKLFSKIGTQKGKKMFCKV